MNAHDMTEEALADLEKKISGVYENAAKDVEKTVTDYFDQFAVRDAEQLKLVEAGELSKNEYTQWRLNQMGRGDKYKDLQNKLSERYTNANEVAHSYIYDETPQIYSLNRNYSAYTIEQAGANVNFNAWNEQAVKRLIVEDPNLMPNYPAEKAIARGIDLAYGRERITACVTSGILQGHSPYQIADDLQKSLENMNRSSAIRSARTAFTSAENAGNLDAFKEAEDMGISMQKEWMATDDDRTREDHLEADGQVVDIDEPFIVGGEELMYPGDPDGEPCQIYNCRCTMVSKIEGVDTENIEETADESFDEWLDEAEDVEYPYDYESLEDVVILRDEQDEMDFFDEDPLTQGWLDSLSIEEADAINGYTAGEVDGINGYLRGQLSEAEIEALNADGSNTIQGYVDNITNALAKSSSDENLQVYRYCQEDVLQAMNIEPGTVVTENAFCSTTVLRDGVDINAAVEMVIDVPAGDGFGAYIQPLADMDSDCHEFLLQRGTDFMVNSVERGENGKTIVHMTVLGNSYR